MKTVFYCILFCWLVTTFGLPNYATANAYKKVTINVIQEQKDLKQFFIQTQTTTYEFPSINSKKKSTLKKIGNYTQAITWIRNDFLAVETFSSAKKLVHLIVQRRNRKNISKIVDKKNKFSFLEVFPVFIQFYPRTEANLKRNYQNLGVNYHKIQIIKKDLDFFYQLGTEYFNILINRKNYRTEKIQRTIHYNKQRLKYEIYFKNWHPEQIFIPQTIEHYLNGHLFKVDQITSLSLTGLTKKKQIIFKKYNEYL